MLTFFCEFFKILGTFFYRTPPGACFCVNLHVSSSIRIFNFYDRHHAKELKRANKVYV